jgi:hypothetical protein
MLYSVIGDRGKFYVGETGHDLKTRFKEHQKLVTRSTIPICSNSQHTPIPLIIGLFGVKHESLHEKKNGGKEK